MSYRSITLGITVALLMGTIIIGTAEGADREVRIPEPQQREDIGLRRLEEEINTISILGRLLLAPQGESLILQAKDTKTYLIQGELMEKLKGLLVELGEKNIVSVRGVRNGSYDIICNNTYKFDAKGNRILDTQCRRYYHLKVNQIIEAKKSDEEIPPPERDIEEEKMVRKSALSQLPPQGLIQIGEIKGKISSLNLRSPIKTVEVTFRDKNNQLINKVLLLTTNTRIAKKDLGSEEPMYLSVNSLQVNQEVNVVYSRDERKTEALFITITKE